MMKFIVSLGLTLMGASAEAAVIQCRDQADAWRLRTGAHRIVLARAVVEGKDVNTSFALGTAYCLRKKMGYEVTHVPGYSQNILPHELKSSQTIRITPLEIRLRAYRKDLAYKLIFDVVVDKKAVLGMINFADGNIPLESLLTKEERQILEKKGQVLISLTTFIMKRVLFENLALGLADEKALPAMTYEMKIRISKTADGLKFSHVD